MRKKIFIWLGGVLATAFIFSPPFLQLLNGLQIGLGGNSALTYGGIPTLPLLLIAWILVGLVWWIILQITNSLIQFFVPFLIAWTSLLFFFSYLFYLPALLLWALFTFLIFEIIKDSVSSF